MGKKLLVLTLGVLTLSGCSPIKETEVEEDEIYDEQETIRVEEGKSDNKEDLTKNEIELIEEKEVNAEVEQEGFNVKVSNIRKYKQTIDDKYKAQLNEINKEEGLTEIGGNTVTRLEIDIKTEFLGNELAHLNPNLARLNYGEEDNQPRPVLEQSDILLADYKEEGESKEGTLVYILNIPESELQDFKYKIHSPRYMANMLRKGEDLEFNLSFES